MYFRSSDITFYSIKKLKIDAKEVIKNRCRFSQKDIDETFICEGEDDVIFSTLALPKRKYDMVAIDIGSGVVGFEISGKHIEVFKESSDDVVYYPLPSINKVILIDPKLIDHDIYIPGPEFEDFDRTKFSLSYKEGVFIQRLWNFKGSKLFDLSGFFITPFTPIDLTKDKKIKLYWSRKDCLKYNGLAYSYAGYLPFNFKIEVV